ncbi:MAG TPA: site-specific integrase [Methylotenera sp.]|nr:site-specific integrase [Methylotenera sp.]
MSLYKRKDSSVWWLKVTVNGQMIQRSTGTTDKTQAQEYHDRLKSDLWERSRLGVKPSRSWQEAVERFLLETQHKASQVSDIYHLKWLDAHLRNSQLNDINRAMLNKLTLARRADKVKNSTINRMLEVINAILRKAVNEWDWLDKAPKVFMLPKAKSRVRWISHDEAEKLISACPPHLAAMVVFSLETGLRKRNVLDLEWSQLDLSRRMAWIHADQAKSRKAIAVPLTDIAMKVIQAQIGKHPTKIFTYRGKSVLDSNNSAFERAKVKAGIKNFRWHDLRHTWASWHIQAGTPLHVLKELGGWADIKMVMIYAHLSVEHLTNYVDKASNIRAVNVEKGYDLATALKNKGLAIS